jgi:PAS domain S-box-containing protein
MPMVMKTHQSKETKHMEKLLQRILIVDDEPANITILGNLLGDLYTILVANTGKNGIRLACAVPPPDVILLDIMMPDMDGYEVCRILQADLRTCSIPIIFITALSSVDDENRGLALGAVDYIHKPFNNSIVRSRVKTHLHLKRQRDQLLKQQQELDSSHQLNRMILETASEGIFGINKGCNITFINPAALRMIGYREEEVLGKNSCSVMHHTKDDGSKRIPVECPACQALFTGKSLEVNQDLYWGQDGLSFPVTFSVAPAFKDGAIVGAVIVFRDITRRQQLERELYKVDKMAAFQVLAGGIAHDFNNLLTIISGNLDMLLLREKSAAGLKEFIVPCRDAVRMATDLAGKFFVIAKGGHSSASIVDIKEAVSQVISSFPTRKDIDWKVIVADDIWSLEAEEVQFLQLLKNIITNAHEAMPDGGEITIRVQNCPDCAERHSTLIGRNFLKISIQDQGNGIPYEHQKKIFDPYFSTKKRGVIKGMGLGMTICSSIMQQHHGLIELDSKTGQGTTVHLYFPVADTVDS